jgi:hypothetical protein
MHRRRVAQTKTGMEWELNADEWFRKNAAGVMLHGYKPARQT